MMLMIYNSKSKQKERFKPIVANQVNMYVCGMTVYDYCHLGHARSVIIFDIIYRFLKFCGFRVNYVRNITDIDDKIIARAHENQQSIEVLTTEMIAAMQADFAALGNLKPTQEPRATHHINNIIAMITTLLDKGYAYRGQNGNVYYNVSRFANYAALSGRQLADLRVGKRVAVASDKRDPLDFALWKASKPGEPSWNTTWGRGRPGWHIECSAMSLKSLQGVIDIHGGGGDLLFPHHDNEIAQSEAATGKPFANYWIHTGLLQINNEKMSKSLNNFFTIRQVLTTHLPETLRYFLLTTHYRSPFHYSEQGLLEAHHAITRLYMAKNLPYTCQPVANSEFEQRFMAAMNDDFNTPEALAVLFDLAREINRYHQQRKNTQRLAALLHYLGNVLGILQQDAKVFLQARLPSQLPQQLTVAEIEQLMAKRQLARQQKNWQLADNIRKQLHAQGVLLEDHDNQTTWRRQ